MSRIVLNEKGCEFEIKSIDYEGVGPSEADLAVVKMSPYGELPVLTERDLFLYDVYVVNEYIDERFPHPQLMPSDPVGRARTRLFCTYSPVNFSRMYVHWKIRRHLLRKSTCSQAPERKSGRSCLSSGRYEVPPFRRIRNG